MHLGLTPWRFTAFDADTLSRQAAFAEELGFESFWLPESHFTANAIPDPLMILASVAAATSRIRLATTSYLLPLRHPVLAAEQVAVLDQLSNGRVLLGVGRGYSKATLKLFDVNPSEKRALFEWCLEEMQRAWRGEINAGQRGDDDGRLRPEPVQKPHPPIWVAAFGPKALAQAGRLGLPYLASPIDTFDELRENYARYDEAAAAAGHGRIETRPLMRTVFVSDDAARCDEVRARLKGAKLPRGLSLAPEVDDWAIVGRPDAVLERIQAYTEALGTTHLVATHLRMDGMDAAVLEASIARLAALLGQD